jgi:small subunit ribosomal protein S16
MVKIRLMRRGATKRPFFRVVVADSRSPRDGRFIENIGKYHPLEDPSLIEIDPDRALYWLNHGAQPTEQVENLLKVQGIWEQFEAGRSKKGPKPAKSARTSKPAGSASARAKTKAAPAAASEEVEAAPPPEATEPAPPAEAPKPKRRRRSASTESS